MSDPVTPRLGAWAEGPDPASDGAQSMVVRRRTPTGAADRSKEGEIGDCPGFPLLHFPMEFKGDANVLFFQAATNKDSRPL
jgi:hypothetical protein